MNLFENIFHNQVLMTFLIASIWIVPGVVFTRMISLRLGVHSNFWAFILLIYENRYLLDDYVKVLPCIKSYK